MKTYFRLIVALCAMVSCERPIIGGEESEAINGNLMVRVFQIEKTSFASLTRSAEPVGDVCTRLNYAVYDQEGSRVKQVNQTSDAPDFGSVSFRLEEGDYMLVVMAHSVSIGMK